MDGGLLNIRPEEFLDHLHPNSPWALTSILDGTVETCNDRAGAEGWLDRVNGHRNAYYNPNIVRQGLRKRAKKADIIAAQVIHVDIDPIEGARHCERAAASYWECSRPSQSHPR